MQFMSQDGALLHCLESCGSQAFANRRSWIDCHDLEYIASSGLRILIRIQKAAKASGSHVVMRGVNADIMNVFKLTGIISVFEFE